MNRATAERCANLRGRVGARVHGLNVNDGIEDRDEMGYLCRALEEAMALWPPFDQFIYRSAAEREGGMTRAARPATSISQSIACREWTRLALKDNPTIMLLLFTPKRQLVCCDRRPEAAVLRPPGGLCVRLGGQALLSG